MSNEKLIKKGLRLQKMMKIYTKMQSIKSKPFGKERFVETSYGKVKVLEYGFDSDEVAPLFVDMHGGGFVLGSAEMDDGMCCYFKEKTKAKIISIDYPKAPRHPFPIGVNACYEVIKHYVDNAIAYKIDSNRIGIGGHSAGANFTTVICIKAKEKGDLSFKFQILDYPPLDMTINPFTRESPKEAVSPKMIDMFNVCYFNNDIEIAKSPYLSPVYATKEQLTGLPPALIIVAGLDSLYDDGVRYHQMLKEADVTVEFHDFKESVHGFTLNKTPDAKEGHDLMVDFINRYI